MRISPLVLAAIFTARSADASGQAPPPRDTPGAPAKGTGQIRGRVTDHAGKALRRARINLDLVGGGSDARRTTSTGLDGAYSFTGLPAGRFRLTATRGGHLELQYGQRRRLAVEVRGINFASFGAGPAVRTNPDGTFHAINVPPGEYSLQASRTAGPDGPAEAALMRSTTCSAAPDSSSPCQTGGCSRASSTRAATSRTRCWSCAAESN